MPRSHKEYADCTPVRILAWVAGTGPCTREVSETILQSRAHPEQGLRSCLGLLRLEQSYDPARLENACRKALAIGSPSYKGVKTILANAMDRAQDRPAEAPVPPVLHDNIRGADYYGALDIHAQV